MMIKAKHPFAVLVCCLCTWGTLFVGCSDRKSVALELDFSQRPTWVYALDIGVKGELAATDSVQRFFNSAQCKVRGASVAGDPSRLRFGFSDLTLFSSVLSESEAQNLRRQVEGLSLTLNSADGTLLPSDSSSFPAVSISGWDLYRTLARVIPSTPQGAMRPGYVWERERAIPLETAMGAMTATLYQKFVFDSLVAAGKARTAFVSWRFTYRINPPAGDSARVLSLMPTSGTGEGRAVFSVDAKTLQEAEIRFVVPRPDNAVVPLSWTETVSLRLEP